MKLSTLLFTSILLFSSFFTRNENVLTVNCVVDAGEDIGLQLGQSGTLEVFTNCLPTDIASVSVSPNDNSITCTSTEALCFVYEVQPLSDVCYTFTVEATDGCISTDEVCVSINSCESLFSENEVAAINPTSVNDSADVTLEVAQTQYILLEVVNNLEGIQTLVWEGWVKEGEQMINVDLSSIPSGTHELVGIFYPTEKSISFEKQ